MITVSEVVQNITVNETIQTIEIQLAGVQGPQGIQGIQGDTEYVGNIDGGVPDSNFGGIIILINGGAP